MLRTNAVRTYDSGLRLGPVDCMHCSAPTLPPPAVVADTRTLGRAKRYRRAMLPDRPFRTIADVARHGLELQVR